MRRFHAHFNYIEITYFKAFWYLSVTIHKSHAITKMMHHDSHKLQVASSKLQVAINNWLPSFQVWAFAITKFWLVASLWSLVVGLGCHIILHPLLEVTSLATSNLWMENFWWIKWLWLLQNGTIKWPLTSCIQQHTQVHFHHCLARWHFWHLFPSNIFCV